MIDLQGISLWRGQTHILRDVSWTTREGEHWAILGPNGCGKTTLLSLLQSFTTASEGSMHIFGHTFGETDWQPVRRAIGLVSSSVRQMIEDRETGLDILISGLHGQINFWGYATKGNILAARKMAALLHAEHLLERPWAVLSQGERQRVLIGRALLTEPRILILDEPCAGLDPEAREEFLERVEAVLLRSAPQVILVTHHVEEILPGFTHVLGLKAGQVAFAGERRAVLTNANFQGLFGSRLRLRYAAERYSCLR